RRVLAQHARDIGVAENMPGFLHLGKGRLAGNRLRGTHLAIPVIQCGNLFLIGFCRHKSITSFRLCNKRESGRRSHYRQRAYEKRVESRECLCPVIDMLSLIFTHVLVSSMLEKASEVKKQKELHCRISDTRKEHVEKDVRGTRRFARPAHPQVA